ncbi:hypothetical protein EYB33_03715 [Lysinibacillus sphaericus]|uniref:hypothetical protein n=1 Tax=Lysinibacillus sphaericus TaxID=1421 RepID=UPI001E425EEE|nr:hypothetical protein [Lysinibacillus sphaericus]UDK95423.1 hypothetical protein EYB33_03715 [Lysinibacillus sphaericus]
MYKILIVEDDMDIAQTLKNQLDKYGYQSVITQDFDKVLDHFQAFQPHLVLPLMVTIYEHSLLLLTNISGR